MDPGGLLTSGLVFGAVAALSLYASALPATVAGSRWLAPFRLTIQREIVMAGLTGRWTAERVIGFQVLLAVLFGMAGATMGWMTACLLSLAGFVIPRRYLRGRVAQRHRVLFRDLPYTIDLLTVVVEAGHDFGVALSRVVDRALPGPLKDELTATLSQIRLGRSRREALRDLADRTGLPELSTLVAALIQTDQLGASLGPALRIQSDELRQARARRAEKLAMEAPMKMLIPLLGFIFPAVFVVLLLPIGLMLLRHAP